MFFLFVLDMVVFRDFGCFSKRLLVIKAYLKEFFCFNQLKKRRSFIFLCFFRFLFSTQNQVSLRLIEIG